VIRATQIEKEAQITTLKNLHASNPARVSDHLQRLKSAAIKNENVFSELMEAAKYCSLGQITNALYKVGGQYRRNM
jgi:methylmalonyl-CoA mutase